MPLVTAPIHVDNMTGQIQEEFENLYAALNAWAHEDIGQQIKKDLAIPGEFSAKLQPAISAYANSTFAGTTGVATATETSVIWQPPDDLVEYYAYFRHGTRTSNLVWNSDFTGVILRAVGVYLCHAQVRWDSNTTGARSMWFTTGGIDEEVGFAHAGTATASMSQHITGLVHVSDARMIAVPAGLQVSVELVQTSGGTRTISDFNTKLSIVKVA